MYSNELLSARLKHMHVCARTLAMSSPSTAAFIESQIDKLVMEHDMPITAARRREICGACGSIMACAGTNAIKCSEAGDMTCQCCGAITTQPVRARPEPTAARAVLPVPEQDIESPARSSIVTPPKETTPSTRHKSSNIRSKERAKTRKQSSLRSMLVKSQQSVTPTRSSGYGIDLMDFMKTD